MIWQLTILYDNVANSTFGPIIVGRTQDECIRIFHDIIADPNTVPGKHPQDFLLYSIGTLDDQLPRLYANSEAEPLLA